MRRAAALALVVSLAGLSCAPDESETAPPPPWGSPSSRKIELGPTKKATTSFEGPKSSGFAAIIRLSESSSVKPTIGP